MNTVRYKTPRLLTMVTILLTLTLAVTMRQAWKLHHRADLAVETAVETVKSTSTVTGKGVVIAPLSSDVVSVNAQLAKVGTFSVTHLNGQGYPIYDLTCDAQQRCFNRAGVPVGRLENLLPQMIPVPMSEVHDHGYRCNRVCYDAQNHIVGRAGR